MPSSEAGNTPLTATKICTIAKTTAPAGTKPADDMHQLFGGVDDAVGRDPCRDHTKQDQAD